MSDNMRIWDKVYETDPTMTKSTTTGAKLTSVNGMYMVKRATEVFGPVGIGWGYSIDEERYDETTICVDQNQREVMGLVHTIRITLWAENKESTVTHYGHTKYRYQTIKGVMVDEEAPKKSLTDAIKKCLSMFGIGGDVFMGQFDDHSYVEEQANKAAVAKADNKVEEQTRQEMEYKEWVSKTLGQIEAAVSMSMLEGVFKSAVRKANNRNDTKTIKTFTDAKDKRVTELKDK